MNSKQVSQLDASGKFVGVTFADESPLEPGIYLLPGGCVDAEEPAIPEGHFAIWNGATFDVLPIPVTEPEPEPEVTPDPEPVPVTVVTMRQARLALLEFGKLSQVQAAIDALSEPTKSAATIEWEYSNEVHRDQALVQMLAPALELSETDLDTLFALAASK